VPFNTCELTWYLYLVTQDLLKRWQQWLAYISGCNAWFR